MNRYFKSDVLLKKLFDQSICIDQKYEWPMILITARDSIYRHNYRDVIIKDYSVRCTQDVVSRSQDVVSRSDARHPFRSHLFLLNQFRAVQVS
jgi:hypothetical protein